MVATADDDKGVTVWGSMQCPYYVQKALDGFVWFLGRNACAWFRLRRAEALGVKRSIPR
jgi:hypothetical protein